MNTLVQDTLLALAAIAVLQIGFTGAQAATPTQSNPPAIEEIIVTAPAPVAAETTIVQPPRI